MKSYRSKTEFKAIEVLKIIGKAGPSKKCKICGNKLYDKGSQEIGIGPECHRAAIGCVIKNMGGVFSGKMKAEELLNEVKSCIDRIPTR